MFRLLSVLDGMELCKSPYVFGIKHIESKVLRLTINACQIPHSIQGLIPSSLVTLQYNIGFAYPKDLVLSDSFHETKWLEWRQSQSLRVYNKLNITKHYFSLLVMKPALPSETGFITSPPKGEQPEAGTMSQCKRISGVCPHRLFLRAFFLHWAQGVFEFRELYYLPDQSAGSTVMSCHRDIRWSLLIYQSCHESLFLRYRRLAWPLHTWHLTHPISTRLTTYVKKSKKVVTHLTCYPDFVCLQAEVDCALIHFAPTPSEIMVLMTWDCETLGAKAA